MSKKMYVKMYRVSYTDKVYFEEEAAKEANQEVRSRSDKGSMIYGGTPPSVKNSVVEEVIVLVKILHAGVIGEAHE